MSHTIKVLYETERDAQAGRDALKAAGLGEHVEILDDKTSDRTGEHLWDVLLDKLLALFGEKHDYETYVEGLRRGHWLLIARVGEFQETRAAEILDATKPGPVDLEDKKAEWKGDGWEPTPAS